MLRKEFEGKSILVAVPDFVGFPEGFKYGLEALGFDVFILRNHEYSKIGFKNTLIHAYRKLVHRDRSFKKKKRKQLDYFKQLESLNKFNTPHFDFALFIRPDLFSLELIELVKKQSNQVVAYQWDGLDVYPEIYTRINLFERFFVFDETDIAKSDRLLPLTNFYFDNIVSTEIDLDVYFVGYYKEDRIENLLLLARKFRELNLKTSINLCVGSSKIISKLKNEPINLLSNQLSFTENIINISRSKIVLDVANIVHTGLSMRPFEAIGYKKKLITNNVLIKKYDFYNPNNIFVIENGNIDGIERFIALPYEELPEEIMKKYSFSNWINYVLDIEPYTPINLPKQTKNLSHLD
ncbi:hypothetical protein [Pedobacter sp.]